MSDRGGEFHESGKKGGTLGCETAGVAEYDCQIPLGPKGFQEAGFNPEALIAACKGAVSNRAHPLPEERQKPRVAGP